MSEESEEKERGDKSCLRICIASPDKIRQWSCGEVKKPETINYRTFKPEPGGFFCERIFGPINDLECACGKYKKIKHKGIICDRCGVEVTFSRVRRERMGHIDLVIPIVHIWFFKTAPSRIGNILELSSVDLERIIYYETRIVTDPGETELKKKQFLSDVEYEEACEQWGPDSFQAQMGAEAIRDLLAGVNLPLLVADLKVTLSRTKSIQVRAKLAKRLKIVEGISSSKNELDWVVFSCLPVIPPELRPLIPLDGGRFATSDLNDLYRRVINRNNRLKRIRQLETPDVILRNEMRMLQEAVDALFDNGRNRHPVLGTGNVPLKSLSEMLKGKQGRFRQNLLGKRTDYSGRSVIVVGPELKLNQCGLPKQMALELFEPFIIRRLREKDCVYTIRSAKKIIANRDPVVWEVLEEVISKHPVLLNRAPTLHRLGIQAFEPVLIEGMAIRVHPLVCASFNADFDGDQMAVHVPLSIEAQMEAKVLMMASDNIFSPSSGKPLALPDQDIALGIYILTQDFLYDPEKSGKKVRSFHSIGEVLVALYSDFQSCPPGIDQEENSRRDFEGMSLHINEKIFVLLEKGERIETTPGRVIFNQIVPTELGFQNYQFTKKKIGDLIMICYQKAGLEKTARFLDELKSLGFSFATKSGTSVGIGDILVPNTREGYFQETDREVEEINRQYERGVITSSERYSKVIGIWMEITEKISEELFSLISKSQEGRKNSFYVMLDSGARGSQSQMKQLGGMRGLMTKPSGKVIEHPIKSNFRIGLKALEFFISTNGARKGLVDTALKTANSGYLTRRLVDVAQDVIVTEEDCGTSDGIEVRSIEEGSEDILPLRERICGRTVCETIHFPGSCEVIAEANEILSQEQTEKIEDAGIESVKIRSVLTCESEHGICIKCYGINLSDGKVVSLGQPIGFIAAQSIGEPGTQLTMRTFHSGGIASLDMASEVKAEESGVVVYGNVRMVKNREGERLVLNKNGKMYLVENEGRSIEEYRNLIEQGSIEPIQVIALELGTRILVEEGHQVKAGTELVLLEQHSIPIICDRMGYVKYSDLIEGISLDYQKNAQSNKEELLVRQYQGNLQPEISLYADKEYKELIGSYFLPSGATILVKEGEKVHPGTYLATLPKMAIKTRDITGGLPRVEELFEARKPKIAAEIAKINGVVEWGGVQKNKRVLFIEDEFSGIKKMHLINQERNPVVQQDDVVREGQALTDGALVSQDILEICGPKKLQSYLVNQVQEVYRLQGVDINDKHIEVIIRQMLRKVLVVDPGDTTLLYGEELHKKKFIEINQNARQRGAKPARGALVLRGITRASLDTTNSFISAASFQDTTRVLTEAAWESKVDPLYGPKENVLIGHKVPIGTGFPFAEKIAAKRYASEKDVLHFSFEDEEEREECEVNSEEMVL